MDKPIITKPKPEKCDACGGSIGVTFYDANLPNVGWGDYCFACFWAYNGKLGTGRGQKYHLDKKTGLYTKVEG